MENKGGAGDSLFAFTENRVAWWGRRVFILIGVLVTVAGLFDNLSVLPSESKTIELADITVLKFRTDQMTSGWGAPVVQHPQLFCMGRICPDFSFEVNYYNEGFDKDGNMKLNCKADMGFYQFLYGLDESTINCKLDGSPNSVIDDSCYLGYSLQNIGTPNILIGCFALFVIFMFYALPSTLLNLSPSEERREKRISGKTSANQPLSPPLPASSEDSSSTGQITENDSSDEAGQTERDPWSDLNAKQQRSHMYWRGFTSAFIISYFVASLIAITISMQTNQMPKPTKISTF